MDDHTIFIELSNSDKFISSYEWRKKLPFLKAIKVGSLGLVLGDQTEKISFIGTGSQMVEGVRNSDERNNEFFLTIASWSPMISSINSSTGLLAALGTRAANTAGSSPAPKENEKRGWSKFDKKDILPSDSPQL